MSRQEQIERIIKILDDSQGKKALYLGVAEILVDNGIGDKDRFEVGEKWVGCFPHHQNFPFIKPIDYKEQK